MHTSLPELLEFLQDNDVKFIRLAFCDLFGVQKNISIMPSELPLAMEQGISFDGSALPGFMNVESSDLFLHPDPATLAFLPWRPATGRVVRFFCDVRYPDGSPFEGDGRSILRKTMADARALDLSCTVGTECEFYLFRTDENGVPTRIPHDQGSYFDVAPLDKGENVRRQICLTLEEMGIQPETSHHEQGPGQHEIDFKYASPLQAADNLITFKWAVKVLAEQNGLFASFLPKPLPDQPGSGLHVNLSLFRQGENLFRNPDTNTHSRTSEAFLAGILRRVAECTVFLNPLVNSYSRFGSFEAPRYITWSHQNRSQLVRIPAAQGDLRRMELRSPDAAINPYLAFSLLIQAGLEGVADDLPLPAPCDLDLFQSGVNHDYPALPQSLGQAAALARNSAFVRSVLPPVTLERYLSAKEAQFQAVLHAADGGAAEEAQLFARC